MKKFYFLILGIVLCGMVAQAQNSYEGHIGFGQHHVVRKGGELNVEVSLDLGAVKLAAQQMIQRQQTLYLMLQTSVWTTTLKLWKQMAQRAQLISFILRTIPQKKCLAKRI